MKIKKYNLCWVFVDSVRRYYAPDDRTKLPFMDKFAMESISVKNMVTCAPSTIMSLSSMMTGKRSSIVADNYNEFLGIDPSLITLNQILKENGWDSTALLMHPEVREKFSLVDSLERKKWPKNYLHSQWWPNKKIFNLLKYLLNQEEYKSNLKPRFWFIDFNCRNDQSTNDLVENTFKLFRKAGYTDKNTIWILCSDHGYPDPSKKITPEYLKKLGIGHDVFMTDDNIMIPFIFKYPGCKAGKVLNRTVSSTTILPTILEIIGLPSMDLNESLLKINDFKKEVYGDIPKVDARFLGQPNGISCLRTDKYKTVIDMDDLTKTYYEIIDLENDITKEEVLSINQISNNNEIKNIDITLINYLQEDFLFVRKRIKKRLKKLLKRSNLKKVNLVSNLSVSYIIAFALELQDLGFDSITVDHNHSQDSFTKWVNLLKIDNPISKNVFQEIDLCIYLGDSNLKKRKNLGFKTLRLDPNLRKIFIGYRILSALRQIYKARKFYFYEPLLAFKVIVNRFLGRFGGGFLGA